MAILEWLETHANVGLAMMLLTCLLSFAWAMKHFFTQPSGTAPGMLVIKWCGTLFGVIHLATLFVAGTAGALEASLAALLYVGALSLFWWTLYTNRNARLSAIFSTDLPGHLMTQGPYRVVRHPFYSSYLLVWIAGAVATGQAHIAVTAMVMAGIYHVAAVAEERKFAQSELAPSYKDYAARTGRFLPNPVKWLRAGWQTQETA